MTWFCKRFDELSALELYKILQLRNEVFVVEQNCVYQDCDYKDLNSLHLFAIAHQDLAAYARLIPKGLSYTDASSIGRVVTSQKFRGKGLGATLMKKAIELIKSEFKDDLIYISAQSHLVKFYGELGFSIFGKPYKEDGIPHIEMRKKL